jgi:hypothetical protein
MLSPAMLSVSTNATDGSGTTSIITGAAMEAFSCKTARLAEICFTSLFSLFVILFSCELATDLGGLAVIYALTNSNPSKME